MLLLDGNTATYGLSLFSKGNRIRSRGLISNQLVLDEGIPLDVEREMNHMDEEQRIFAFMENMTGKTFQAFLIDTHLVLEVYRPI
ncbi:MAG: hypothetical protein HC880_03730 [Bacteroidia bacterium]|nr:hypothetical protein [Bacteroidia bacterium]